MRLSNDEMDPLRRTSDSVSSSSRATTPENTPLLYQQESSDSLTSTAALDDEPSSDDTPEEQILQVVDTIEDEFDEHTYEDIIPLDIKLAIEENVFGWSHLTSSIMGHIVFTLGAFLLAYTALWHVTEQSGFAFIFGLVAGGASFRMVRRRRRVWLRAPYGSRKYRQDTARRQKEVEEADKAGWLGRVRQKRRQKSLARQLSRAETSFLKHHERQLRRAQSAPLDHEEESTSLKRRRPSFRTDPVPVMQSVQQDQAVFACGPIHRMPYSHGGFFGAAPFMLANPYWISILRHLMPDVYVEISRRVNAPPQRLIHWAENNPVVAAYGSAHEIEYNGKLPNIEWDVFLNPALVKSVFVVLQERDKFLSSISSEIAVRRPFQNVTLPEELSSGHRSILRYYNSQLRKRVRLLVDKMLIAHGNLSQLLLEQTGVAKQYNYSRVRRTRRTLGGGIYARQWMAVYAESLRIGVRDGSPSSSPTNGSPSSSPSNKESAFRSTLNSLAESSCPDTTMVESVNIVKAIAKRDEPIGLVLDLKSRHVPKAVLACVVDALREAGIRVEGAGSFVVDEIRGLSRCTARPVKEFLFFHSAGDLQQACHDGLVQTGDHVFFNAGSLLWDPSEDSWSLSASCVYQQLCSTFDSERAKHSYQILPFAQTTGFGEKSFSSLLPSSTIEQYKRHFKLSIGLYVQEFAIDDAAVEILVEHINHNPHLYDLGLSWGGVNGITIRGIQPGRFTRTDGFWNQRHMAHAWNPALSPAMIQRIDGEPVTLT